MADLKSCSRCGRIHPRGYQCGVKRTYKDTEDRKARNTYAWHRKARQIKEDAQGLCEVCRAEGVYTYEGLEVHHIVKVKEDKDKLLDDYNLVCLCVKHHKDADEGRIDAEYLKRLAKERVEK